MCGNDKQPLHGSRLCSKHWDHNLQTGGSLRCATKCNCTLISFFLLPLLPFFSSCFSLPLLLLPSPFSSLPLPTSSSLPPSFLLPLALLPDPVLHPTARRCEHKGSLLLYWDAFAEWYSQQHTEKKSSKCNM